MSNDLETLVTDVKKSLAELEKKAENYGKDHEEYKSTLDKVAPVVAGFEEFKTAQLKVVEEQKAQIKKLEDSLSKRSSVAVDPRLVEKEVKSVFGHALVNADGKDRSIVELGIEVKTRNATDGAAGGFMVTPTLASDMLVTWMKDSSPMLREATILSGSDTSALKIPRKLLIEGAKATGELQSSKGKTDRKLSLVTVNMNRIYTQDETTDELLRAQALETESSLVTDMINDLGYNIQFDMLRADGNSKADGLLNEQFLLDTAHTSTAPAGKLTWTDLFNVQGKFNYEKYRSAGKYFMSFNVFLEFLTEKDQEGRAIYMPGINGAPQSTLAGRPFVIFPDMDQLVASNSIAVLYGDMKQAYIGRVDGNYKTYRDEITRKKEGVLEIGIATFSGGTVKDEEAIRAIKGA